MGFGASVSQGSYLVVVESGYEKKDIERLQKASYKAVVKLCEVQESGERTRERERKREREREVYIYIYI